MKALTVSAYVAGLRRRARWYFAVRAAATALGCALLGSVAVALLVGPLASTVVAGLAWGTIAALSVASALFSLREARDLRGDSAAKLLAEVRPDLVSSVRTALELPRDPRVRETAPDMLSAHEARVIEALEPIPPSHVVRPGPWLTQAGLVLAPAIAITAFVFAVVPGTRAGLYAILHPDAQRHDGVAYADVVAHIEARLSLPAHHDRDPLEAIDPTILEAPRGTTVDLDFETRVPVLEARLRVAGREVRIERVDDRRFTGQFVLRESGPLLFDAVLDASRRRWVADPTRRGVQALEDHPPEVSLRGDDPAAPVPPDAVVAIGYRAVDDVGLEEVDLVLRLPSGDLTRRSLARLPPTPLEVEREGETTIALAELPVRPGDHVVAWIEARDGDRIDGPHVGRSEERTIVLASEASARAETLGELDAIVGAALDALAIRLETPVPSNEGAEARWEAAQTPARDLVQRLEALARRSSSDPALRPSDAGIFAASAREVRNTLQREARVHEPSIGSQAARVDADRRVTGALERRTLELDDLVRRARLSDAVAIARELDELRREMTSLLAELRRAPSEEARRALLTALGRAEQRLAELHQRLAALSRDVPSSFLNLPEGAEALRRETLASMRDAIERGDLEAAERTLQELRQEVDGLSRALGTAEERFVEASFGPRERAMAEVLDALASLEAEQRRLAERSDLARRDAAEAAAAAEGSTSEARNEAIRQQATRAAGALERVPRGSLGTTDREALDRIEERVRDVGDALRSGDLGEAQRMAEAAVSELDGLTRDLELSALMFPGTSGGTARTARAARSALDATRALRSSVQEAIPSIGDFVPPGTQHQMTEDARAQGAASDRATQLAEQLRRGPDGTPLSPPAADALDEARGAMERGRRALEETDPVTAARAQDEAARRLTELREQLERDRGGGGRGGGGGREGGAGEDSLAQGRVRIPDASEHHGPDELRRRLLDAMSEDAPARYSGAVQRYYEELLR